ncbi:MAG: hypothetical protein R2844_04740 [Caldilineales bacterium]
MTGAAADAPSAATRAWRLVPWLLVLLFAALNLVHISRLGPNDDAYITYRVARNLAQGIGPVYNPGEHVLTVTTPGYALLLAAISPLSGDFVLLGFLLNGLALLAVGALLIDLSRTTLAALVAVTLTLTFPLLSEALGMETPLYLAAILAAFAAFQRATASGSDPRRQERWLMATAAAAAAAFLLRPDGLLVALAIGAYWLATARLRRTPWKALAVFALLVTPWLLFATGYYGSPVPNTLPAKATQALTQAIPRWGAGLLTAADDWALLTPVAAALAVVGLALTLLRQQKDRLPLLLWAALFVAGHVLLGVRSYFWYYVPLMPVVALLAGDAVAAAADWLAARPGRHQHAHLIRAALIACLVALALLPLLPVARSLAQQPELRRREEAYLQTAETLREMCSESKAPPLVGLAEIGLIGYVSNCRIVDFAGLLQPDVAHLKLNPAEKMVYAIKRYAPDLVALTGGVNYPAQVGDADWFRERYETVDIYDRGGFRSVIHRKAPGPASQRDIAIGSWRRDNGPARASTTLYFEPGINAAITLHVFMPVRSTLDVSVNGAPPRQVFVGEPQWVDIDLAPFDPDGPTTLSLALAAPNQPAAVAWIESNAVPSVHYFAPFDDASQRPRPTIRFDAGETASVRLAPAAAGPAMLELLHRDRPGVALEVNVNGQPLAVVGGTDGWRSERIPLPDGLTAGQEPITVEIHNQGSQFARLAYLMLAPDKQGPAP